jgi:hypothetical protein
LKGRMMAPENLPQDRPERYASIAEVRQAINSLSDMDHVKLMMVAQYFCNQRRLRRERLEPQELLNEAIKRTLNGERKWRKGAVGIVRHLDRTMESISGHAISDVVAEFDLKRAVFNEEFDTRKNVPRSLGKPQAEIRMLALEQLQEIKALFDDEPIALSVLHARAEGKNESEIMTQLGIDKRQYEAVRKKIERKMASYIQKSGVSK